MRSEKLSKNIGEKQRQAAKILTSYRKSMSLNPFSVRYSRPAAHAQTLSLQKSPKMVLHTSNDGVFSGLYRKTGALNSNMTLDFKS